MAFNFMQFAGGFADVIVDKVKAEEAQARDDESWDRRFNKQQDAIDKRTRGDKRRATEAEAAKLAEKLSLLYTPEQSKYIMGLGTGAIETAVERGNYYLDNDQVPSEMFNMPARKPEIIEGAPIADAPQLTETQQLLAKKDAVTPFTGRFKPIPPKIDAAKGSWEAELVRLNHGIQTTAGDKQLEFQRLYDSTYTEYEKWKTKTKEAGAGEEIDVLSNQSRASFLSSTVDGVFAGTEIAEMDAEGRFAQIVEGSEPEAYFLMNEAISTMKDAYVNNEKFSDPTNVMPKLVESRRRANNLAIKAYKKETVVDYLEAKKAFEATNKGVAFVQPASQAKFILDTNKQRTYDDVVRGSETGEFRSGMVVQYVDENDVVRAALISKYGVIG